MVGAGGVFLGASTKLLWWPDSDRWRMLLNVRYKIAQRLDYREFLTRQIGEPQFDLLVVSLDASLFSPQSRKRPEISHSTRSAKSELTHRFRIGLPTRGRCA